jgi:hypothetical protein
VEEEEEEEEEEDRDLRCHDNSHKERKTDLVAVSLLTLEESTPATDWVTTTFAPALVVAFAAFLKTFGEQVTAVRISCVLSFGIRCSRQYSRAEEKQRFGEICCLRFQCRS